MPEAASPAQSVLEALGFVLFAREESGALRLLGKAPAWLTALWPALAKDDRTLLPVADASPFLENFLIDAEECWKKGGEERAESGPWIEQDKNGAQVELEATAMTARGQPIFLLERLGEAFAAKKAVLQHARETVIAHQRLNSEIQKKQILLHSVANEIRASLANVITSLRLIQSEETKDRTKVLLRLAMRATDEQQDLIEHIVGVFREELEGVYGPASAVHAVTEWTGALRDARAAVGLSFAEKEVQLESSGAELENVKIATDPVQLERLLTNLLENALEKSPPGSAVIVRAEEEPENLLVSFEDRGSIVGETTCGSLFTKEISTHPAPTSAMRLQFCRIVIENCDGEMGCSPLPAGGNHFWIRLPKYRV